MIVGIVGDVRVQLAELLSCWDLNEVVNIVNIVNNSLTLVITLHSLHARIVDYPIIGLMTIPPIRIHAHLSTHY